MPTVSRHDLPFTDGQGQTFSFHTNDLTTRLLHQIDTRASTQLLESDGVGRSGDRNRYLISSLMDEAITSIGAPKLFGITRSYPWRSLLPKSWSTYSVIRRP